MPNATPSTLPTRAVTAVERSVLLNRGHQRGLVSAGADSTQRVSPGVHPDAPYEVVNCRSKRAHTILPLPLGWCPHALERMSTMCRPRPDVAAAPRSAGRGATGLWSATATLIDAA